MIITRRFWCCNTRSTKAIFVDVRTCEEVTAAEARAKAEAFAARKLRHKGVWAMRIARHGAAQFTIGPRRC
jgi:hypothetical protein